MDEKVFLVKYSNVKKKIKVSSLKDAKIIVEKKFSLSFQNYYLEYFDDDFHSWVNIDDDDEFQELANLSTLRITSSDVKELTSEIEASTIDANQAHFGVGDNIIINKESPDSLKPSPEKTKQNCSELIKDLQNIVKKNCGINKAPFVNQEVKTVPLQITKNAQHHLSKDLGHHHHRYEREVLYSNPPIGDVTVETLFDRSFDHAKSESSKMLFNNTESEENYIEIHSNLVCILGQAGAGKTTLAKMTSLRVAGEEKLYEADYVFHARFRDLDYTNQSCHLFHVLAPMLTADWLDYKQQRDAVITKLEKSNKVVIILDGFDEARIKITRDNKEIVNAHAETSALNFILNILNGNILSKAKKIITSRPRAINELPDDCRPHFLVNILGFDMKAQIHVCVDICRENAIDVFAHIQKYPDLKAYCYNPLQCILVMFTLNKLISIDSANADLPTSVTGILTVVLRLFKDSGHNRRDMRIRNISRLAWNGFKNEKINFTEQDVQQAGLNSSDLDDLFVMTRQDHKLFLLGGCFENVVYFAHLILQEFFSAVYLLVFVDSSEFRKLFFDESQANNLLDLTSSRFEMVLKFMFGLCNRDTHYYLKQIIPECYYPKDQAMLLQGIVLQPLFPLKMVNERFLQFCNCAHELQDGDFSKQLANQITDNLLFDSALLPSDVLSFHYVLQFKIHSVIVELISNHHFFGKSWKEFFTRTPFFIKITKLEFSQKTLGDEGACLISAHLEKIKSLKIGSNNITSVGLKSICDEAQKLKEPMEELDLSGNNFGDDGALLLSKCLDRFNKLSILTCGFTPKGLKIICDHVRGLEKPIEELGICEPDIGDEGARILSTCLNKIKHLLFRQSCVTENGLKFICDELKLLNQPMKRLNLGNNNFGDKGAVILATCLNKINELVIRGCDLSPIGFHLIGDAVKKLDKPIDELDVCLNKTGDEGVCLISTCINKVNKLFINDCKFTWKGMKEISDQAKQLDQPVEVLDISSNEIGDEGACELSKCLGKFGRLVLLECDISAEGLKPICEEAKQLDHQIEEMELGWNLFGDEGAILLSSCLCKFKKLNLWNCEITIDGIKAICDAAVNLEQPMEELELTDNKLGDEGAHFISKCLNKINKLVLENCEISFIGLKSICDETRTLDKPMKELNLSGNKFGDEGVHLLSSCLHKIDKLVIRNCRTNRE